MASYKAPRIIGAVFKLLLTVIVATVCGILIWRVFFSTNVPKSVAFLAPNAALHEAYGEEGDAITLRYQNLASITKAKKNYGYFSVTSAVFIPEAEQVQIVFRYNNSTIRHLQQDKGLATLPQKSEHLFDVTLVKTTDLTPENKEDNLDESTLGKERIYPEAEPIRDETSLYSYYRYVFNGVTIEDVTDAIYVDVYYVGDLNYEEDAYGTLCIYAWDEKWIAYKPTKQDKSAMMG